MAVLNELSVGSIVYQLVDSIPTHSATAGVVALDVQNGKYFIYNLTGWESLITPSYGRIYFSGSSVLTDVNDNNWYLDCASSIGGSSPGNYTVENLLGFTSSFGGELRIIRPEDIGRYLLSSSTTILNVTNAHLVECGPYVHNVSKDQSVNLTTIGRGIRGELHRSTPNNGFYHNIISHQIVDLFPNQCVSLAKRYSLPAATATTGYRIVNNSIQVLKLEDAIVNVFFEEEWSTGTFSTNSWSVVNDSVNQWVIGTAATASTGSYSAYISNNGGVSHTYTTANVRCSHLYRDVTFPDTTSNVYLYFDWKCYGEDSLSTPDQAQVYDYGTVVIALTSSTPVAGTELFTTQATIFRGNPTGSGRIGASTNAGKFLGFNNLYGGQDSRWRPEMINMNNYRGLTRRLIFTWKNDISGGNNPPFAVDNIRIFTQTYI